MKNDWQILTLGGYLEEKTSRTPQGVTFTRTLLRTEELPEVTVGLGLLKQNAYSLYVVEAVPAPFKGKMENSFIAAVAETYLQVSDYSNWQEHLLLELGYTVSMLTKESQTWDPEARYSLFNPIPETERESLLRKHGFHKVAMMVSYGVTEDMDTALTEIDKMRGDVSYGDILRVMALGVPVEDLAVAAQLPDEMVAEIYGDQEPEGHYF